MIKRFAKYYKPHMRLFLLDLFCALLVSLCNLFYPFITQEIINVYIPNKEMTIIIVLLVSMLLVYGVKVILGFVIQYWGHAVGVRIQSDMRGELFEHLEQLPFTYYDENKTGEVMSRLINDLMDICELAHHCPEDIFLSAVTLIGACTLMFLKIDPWLTLIAFIPIPFIVLFAALRNKKMRGAFKKMREETGEINARAESSISGIRVTKAYAAANYEVKKFKDKNTSFIKARMHAYKEMGIFYAGAEFLIDILFLLALAAGAIFFYYDRIDAGQLTGYILYVNIIINPIFTISNIFEQIQNGITGFKRFTDIMDLPIEIEKENAIFLSEIKQKIQFKNVSFKYSSVKDEIEQRYVLSNLNLDINKGKTVALVGPSGGGKTTICHLIPRFYDVTSGEILIDGINVKDFTLTSLRSCVGLVSQDVFLFAGTILENVAYGKSNATLEEITEACKKANIYEFIMGLEKKFDTYVGERGVKLSGGQKQRISIARAFLKNPQLLILDEATSALDNATEMQIQSSLEELSVGRTTIVVAHRLSTVKNADEIVVISDVGVIERGTHEELIKLNGTYANLYQYQFRVE